METMPPVAFDETEEDRKRRAAAMPPVQPEPFKPGSLPYKLTVGATSQPNIPQKMPPVTIPAPELGAPAQPQTTPLGGQTMPPVQPAPAERSQPLEPHPGMPPVTQTAIPGPGKAEMAQPEANAMPPVTTGPAQQQFKDLAAQGPPQPKWWQRALEIAGSVAPFGLAIEKQLPQTPIGYNAKLNQAGVRAAKEQSLEEGEQKIRSAPAEAELKRRNVESEISARGNKDESALAKIGMKRDANGEIVPDENSEVFKGQQAKITTGEETAKQLNSLREAQKELATARTEVERAKNDPNSPAFKAANQRLIQAQRAHEIAAQNLGLHQQEFANKLHEQDLVKPSGQSQSRGSAAQSVINLLPGLEASVRKNAGSMGPLMGRLAKGEIAIGNVPPDVAELYSAMKSFYALQPAVHGFRNAEFVKDFEHALGTLERDPEAFIAGMKGLKPTLESVANEGKTFHKRIVEGEAPPASGGKSAVWNPKTGKYE